MKMENAHHCAACSLAPTRLLLVIALFLATIEPLWAAPYGLMMSKDDQLCNSMLRLYNADMEQYGEIKYKSHEVFSRIHWSKVFDLSKVKDLYKPDVAHLIQADFDSNNDGAADHVIRQTWQMNYALQDSLYIFPLGSDIDSRLNPGLGGLKALVYDPDMIMNDNHSLYYLKELPESMQQKVLAYKRKHLPKNIKTAGRAAIGITFVLWPFIWNGDTYISITDRNPEWIVIGKYRQVSKIQDVCYYHDDSHRFVNY